MNTGTIPLGFDDFDMENTEIAINEIDISLESAQRWCLFGAK